MTGRFSVTAGETDRATAAVFASGLELLTLDSPWPEFFSAFQRLTASLEGASPLEREGARRITEALLTDRGISDSRRFVAAALGKTNGNGNGALTAPPSTPGHVVVFADPDPWPSPVDGAALIADLIATLERFVVLPDGGSVAIALWVLHAHAFDATTVSPLLALLSPEKRCGKSTTLTVIGALVPRPLPVANITGAALFRSVERFKPTLLGDEADTFLDEADELRGIFNSGWTRAGAVVVRTVGDDFEPRLFSTWCPKVLARIGTLHDTLHDRSIVVTLRRRAPGESVERLRLDRLADLEPTRRRAWRWAQDHIENLRAADPSVPQVLHDRAADNWRPLLAIADLAGGVWPASARRAALVLAGAAPDAEGPAVQLLAACRDVLTSRGADRLASADLLESLNAREMEPWSEWSRGKPMTVRQLARLLVRFGIRPQVIRIGDRTPRGYLATQFADAWGRYLPTDPQPPQQSLSALTFKEMENRNLTPSVAEAESKDRRHGDSDVALVADEKGVPERVPGKGDAFEGAP